MERCLRCDGNYIDMVLLLLLLLPELCPPSDAANCEDPAEAPDPLSDPEGDGPILKRLVDLAQRQWGVSWRGSREQWASFGIGVCDPTRPNTCSPSPSAACQMPVDHTSDSSPFSRFSLYSLLGCSA